MFEKNTQLAERIAGAISIALKEMNNHINANGQINRSSQVIKNWHVYDNYTWELILSGAKYLNEQGCINLKGYTERDLDFLLEHLAECYQHTNNVLFPNVKTTGNLPASVTHANPAKYQCTIKTRTFRTMMNLREALCEALDIDLPNEDSSKGKLNATPMSVLFA